jgi:hypothetical protein
LYISHMSKAFITKIKIQKLSNSNHKSIVDNANAWSYIHEVRVTILS